MKIQEYISRQQSIEEAAKEKIIKAILALPDNPRIKYMDESKRCFVIQSSDLFARPNGSQCSRWSPEYHSFLAQYRAIVNELKERTLGEVAKWLQEALEKKSFVIRGTRASHTFHLHPEVVKNILEIPMEI